MIDLKTVLQNMTKTYNFKVKIAQQVDADKLAAMDVILKAKGMSKRTRPEALPMNASPIDFPRLKGYFGTIYKIDMEFEYPITETTLKNELCSLLNIDRSFVIVRVAESPLEQYNDDYLEYKDEDYISQLMSDGGNNEVNADEHYGDEYNKELVKTLQSTEGKKHQQGHSEVEEKAFNGHR